MVGHTLGKFGHQGKRVKMTVDPVNVALQHGGVGLDGPPRVGCGVIGVEWAALVLIVVEMVAVHPDVFMVRGNRTLAQVHEVTKFETGHPPKTARKWVYKKVTRCSLVKIPGGAARLGVDDEVLANTVAAVDLEQHLEIDFRSPIDIEADFAPAQVKRFFEVVVTGEGCSQLTFDGNRILFGEFHRFSS